MESTSHPDFSFICTSVHSETTSVQNRDSSLMLYVRDLHSKPFENSEFRVFLRCTYFYLECVLAGSHILTFPSISVQFPEIIPARQHGFLKIVFSTFIAFSINSIDQITIKCTYSSVIQATKLWTEKISHTAS